MTEHNTTDYYTLMFKSTMYAERRHLPLKPYKATHPYYDRWSFCGDNFGRAITPRVKGYSYEPKYKTAYEDMQEVRNRTGFNHAWSYLKFAKDALKRAREMDKKGEFDGTDCRWRHKFKIVRCTSMFQTVDIGE